MYFYIIFLIFNLYFYNYNYIFIYSDVCGSELAVFPEFP